MDRNQVLKRLVDLVKLLSHATLYEVGNTLDNMDAGSLADLDNAIDKLENLCTED